MLEERTRERSDPDRSFYDEQIPRDDAGYARWMREIQVYFEAYAKQLDETLQGTSGIVAELGAGSCGLSLCASRLQSVREVHCLDISRARMDHSIELSQKYMPGQPDKLRIRAGNFNEPLPFADGSVNAVLFDASLHHARSLWDLLSECNRVLTGAGLLIAQREQTLSPLRAGPQLRRLLGTPEVRRGVAENAYLKAQYEYYLTAHGFRPHFLAVESTPRRRRFRLLNGILFCDGVFLAHKERSLLP